MLNIPSGYKPVLLYDFIFITLAIHTITKHEIILTISINLWINILHDQVLIILTLRVIIKLDIVNPFTQLGVIVTWSNGITIGITLQDNHLGLPITIFRDKHCLYGGISVTIFLHKSIFIRNLWLCLIRVHTIMVTWYYLKLFTIHIIQDRIYAPIFGLISNFWIYGVIHLRNQILHMRNPQLPFFL